MPIQQGRHPQHRGGAVKTSKNKKEKKAAKRAEKIAAKAHTRRDLRAAYEAIVGLRIKVTRG